MGYKGEIPATHYGTKDVHLDVGSGVVYWIVVHPSAATWDIIIRDGSDDNAEIILRAYGTVQTGRPYRFNPPLPYERGLFVDVVTAIQSFTIAYDHQD